MKATIRRAGGYGVSSREREDFEEEVRRVANLKYETRKTLTTAATGADTAIWTSDRALSPNTQATLQAKVHGSDSTGANYGSFEYIAEFLRPPTGAASQLGATTAKFTPLRSNAAITVTLGVDSDSKLFVKVNDGSLATLDWSSWIEVRAL